MGSRFPPHQQRLMVRSTERSRPSQLPTQQAGLRVTLVFCANLQVMLDGRSERKMGYLAQFEMTSTRDTTTRATQRSTCLRTKVSKTAPQTLAGVSPPREPSGTPVRHTFGTLLPVRIQTLPVRQTTVPRLSLSTSLVTFPS